MEATVPLVLMFISLYSKWKLSISYYFQNKIFVVSQAELVKLSLKHTHDIGIKVWSVVCDSPFKVFIKLHI